MLFACVMVQRGLQCNNLPEGVYCDTGGAGTNRAGETDEVVGETGEVANPDDTGKEHYDTGDVDTENWGKAPERSVWVSTGTEVSPLLYGGEIAFASTPDSLQCSGEEPGICATGETLVFASVHEVGMGVFTEDGEGTWTQSAWVKTYLPSDVGGAVDQSFAFHDGRYLQVGFALPKGWENDGADPRDAPNPHRIVITASANGEVFTYSDGYVIAEADNLTDPDLIVLPTGECVLYVGIGPNTARAYSEDCVSFGELEVLAVAGGVPDAAWNSELGEISLVLSEGGGLSLVTSTDGGAGRVFGDPVRLAEGASSGTQITDGRRIAYQVP